MISWPAICIAAIALVFSGCGIRIEDRTVAVEQPPPGKASVGFDLEPVPSGDGSRQWIGTYNSRGKIAKFRIDFGAPESTPGKPSVKSGEGTLIPEPGSDSSGLLVELQKTLQAKTAPKGPLTKTSVPFTYVTVADNLSRTNAGGFNANPPGNWTSLKLTFGDGDRECEILLHINAGAKKAQFSMKDPGYGDLALAELAKVL